MDDDRDMDVAYRRQKETELNTLSLAQLIANRATHSRSHLKTASAAVPGQTSGKLVNAGETYTAKEEQK